MRILVTGTDGYIGSQLAPYLMERGQEVVGLDVGYYRDGCLYNDFHPVPTTSVNEVETRCRQAKTSLVLLWTRPTTRSQYSGVRGTSKHEDSNAYGCFTNEFPTRAWSERKRASVIPDWCWNQGDAQR